MPVGVVLPRVRLIIVVQISVVQFSSTDLFCRAKNGPSSSSVPIDSVLEEENSKQSMHHPLGRANDFALDFLSRFLPQYVQYNRMGRERSSM